MTVTPTSMLAVDPGSPIRLLIAEDEAHLGTILEQFLTARGFRVTMVRDGRAALERLRREPFDVALLDVVMPEVDGLEVLRLVRELPLPPEIIVITGNGTIETAMAALRLGAYDFLSKPYRMAEIEALVRRAWEKRVLVRDNRYLRLQREREAPAPAFLTQFAPLRAVLNMVQQFAASPLPVLVSGEVGTGKTTIARLLHGQGPRPDGPFVTVDCATFVASRQSAELFAHDAPGVGAVEMATGGTILLANVDALGAAAQAMLLAVLDSGVLPTPAGAPSVALDVRVMATTTRDLSALVAAGQFDELLAHRLSAMRVSLPPLRERAVDVPLLAQHFLELTRGGSGRRFSDDTIGVLERYPWPGNVSELRLVVERAALATAAPVIDVGGLALSAPTVPPAPVPSRAPSLGDLERQHIASVLEATHWHQGRAAELLGISPKTLYRKIREYGFARPSGRNA